MCLFMRAHGACGEAVHSEARSQRGLRLRGLWEGGEGEHGVGGGPGSSCSGILGWRSREEARCPGCGEIGHACACVRCCPDCRGILGERYQVTHASLAEVRHNVRVEELCWCGAEHQRFGMEVQA